MRPILKNLMLVVLVVALIPLALLAFPLLAARLLARHLSAWTRGNAPSAAIALARSSRRGSAPSRASVAVDMTARGRPDGGKLIAAAPQRARAGTRLADTAPDLDGGTRAA
jgi:hypothetical protein